MGDRSFFRVIFGREQSKHANSCILADINKAVEDNTAAADRLERAIAERQRARVLTEQQRRREAYRMAHKSRVLRANPW